MGVDEDILDSLILHRFTVENQCDQYKKCLASINSRTLVVVQDYTRFHETSKMKLHDLGLVVYRRKDNVIDCEYFDFIADYKHDYAYTKAVWDLFFKEYKLRGIKELIVWSDNGLKSVQNIRNFGLFSESKKINITLNYFAPCHGHSICDRHFGLAKISLRREFSVKPIRTKEDIMNIVSNMQATTCYDVTVKPIAGVPGQNLTKGIRQFLEWRFVQQAVVGCREHIGIGD